MKPDPGSLDFYNLPNEKLGRAIELRDGSLLFETRDGVSMTAPPRTWTKNSSGGYVVLYGVLQSFRDELKRAQ